MISIHLLHEFSSHIHLLHLLVLLNMQKFVFFSKLLKCLLSIGKQELMLLLFYMQTFQSDGQFNIEQNQRNVIALRGSVSQLSSEFCNDLKDFAMRKKQKHATIL